jgi:dipeptidyl aminopeptidase/acylaminoacyl peptidase
MTSRASRILSRFAIALAAVAMVLVGFNAPAQPAQAAPASVGRILYLAADGVTIKSMKPDGTGSGTIYTIRKGKQEVVSGLSADPTGQYIIYGLTANNFSNYNPNVPYQNIYLLHKGVAKKLPSFTQMPNWSPDGKRFVAQTDTGGGLGGKAYVYNVTNNTYLYLPFKGLPDWSPDGTKYVYTDGGDVFLFTRSNNAITRLTRLPHNDKTNAWVITEAHITPDGKRVLFFGQEYVKGGEYQIGASGNGLQWYWLPITGGTPQPLLDPEGNGVVTYAASAQANKFAYVGNAHDSACASVQQIAVVDAGKTAVQAGYANTPGADFDNELYVEIEGVAWSPDGTRIAYSVTPYNCADFSHTMSAPSLYVSTVPAPGADGTQPTTKLVSGTFPVWVK